MNNEKLIEDITNKLAKKIAKEVELPSIKEESFINDSSYLHFTCQTRESAELMRRKITRVLMDWRKKYYSSKYFGADITIPDFRKYGAYKLDCMLVVKINCPKKIEMVAGCCKIEGLL
jgi:hypothetical protein